MVVADGVAVDDAVDVVGDMVNVAGVVCSDVAASEAAGGSTSEPRAPLSPTAIVATTTSATAPAIH